MSNLKLPEASVYPNPASNYSIVRFFASENSQYKITLTDISGKRLITQSGTASIGQNEERLNLQGYGRGTYLLQVENGSRFKTMKLIIQ